MTNEPLHFVFAGGGTGGHLFPGLAVAERLVEIAPQARITFAGSERPIEHREVAAAGFEHLVLPCRPLPRRVGEAFSFVVENLAGFFAASRLLDEDRVSVVVGLGGFASVPMARAAARHGVPLILLEQNVIPGRATRWLARFATEVCAGLAQTRSNLQCRCPVRVTGTPTRAATVGERQRQVVVFGGSQGARIINQHVPRALYKVRAALDGWRIVHQSGATELEATRQLYRKLGLDATVEAFIDRMPEVLAESRLAVCRAGGSTLAELAVAGLPAVLLPLPHATDDHQRANADVYANAGCAIALDESRLPGRPDDHLAGAVAGLLGNALRREAMSAAMHRLARPNAAIDIAELVLEIARQTLPSQMPAAA